MTAASRMSKQSVAVELDPQLRAGLEMAACRPIRRNGNPWGLKSVVSVELERRGWIMAGTTHHPNNPSDCWPTWKITLAGRQALAASEGGAE
jgi:hypothetical protein